MPERVIRLRVGFRTHRHSFASNLAAGGVGRRVIDEFRGRTTEAMRERYRRLALKVKKSAIEALAFGPVGADGRAAG